MMRFQNGQHSISAASMFGLLSDIDEESEYCGARERQTLHQAIERFIKQLEICIDELGSKPCTQKDQMYWRIQGCQETLRWVARQLKTMQRQYEATYCFYKALMEYQECLITSSTDANEEARDLQKYQRKAWIIEGEADVLSCISMKLLGLMDHHAPKDDPYVLSLDGRNIVFFPESEDEPVPVEKECLIAAGRRH